MDHPATLKSNAPPPYLRCNGMKERTLQKEPSTHSVLPGVTFEPASEEFGKMKTPRIFSNDGRKIHADPESETELSNPTPPPRGDHRPHRMRSPSAEDTDLDFSPAFSGTIRASHEQDDLWTDNLDQLIASDSTSSDEPQT